MKPFSITLQDCLANLVHSAVQGAYAGEITGVASLNESQAGDLSFLGNTKYTAQLANCRASVVLVPDEQEGTPAQNQVWIKVKDPSFALSELCRLIENQSAPGYAPGVHPTAVVDEQAAIDSSVHIGAYCVIEAGVKIGAGTVVRAYSFIGKDAVLGARCTIFERVTITHDCVIGDAVQIQSGSVIGSDGYGYDFQAGSFHKIPHLGNVVLEDQVEIGACVTIDRGRFKETRIGAGTKIDNQVQIAHNVRTGKHCLIVSQAGVAGSTALGDYVTLGGQTGIAGHLSIGSQSKVGSQGGVSKSLPEKSFVSGTPAMDFNELYRMYALQRKLPQLVKRIEALEKELSSAKGNPS